MKDRFYEFLKSQFSNLEEAKFFMHWWFYEADQELPVFGMFSIRAMACYVSLVLQGYDTDPDGDEFFTSYYSTEYGPELYQCLFWADEKKKYGSDIYDTINFFSLVGKGETPND